ncbi:serine/threonine protein kinase [Candidatus Vecturithrix granuli]|uniref:Serine/threonine protein kinase n=1 Tax=Vecturithrix granuli TaxID=1499967 RepID=A0A081C7N9_VECG1|nr:serine/threonine protein kinase [Candidatus Vecturithrix granuli]
MDIEAQGDIKVFICYAREDMAIAKYLYQDLRQPGIRPWMDTEDLQPGQQWKEVIADELQRSDFVLVLLSSRSLTEYGYVRKELNDILDLVKRCPSDRCFLIPVRLEACEPKEEQLRQIQCYDLFLQSYPKGLTQIFKVLLPNGRRVALRREPMTVSEKDRYKVFELKGHNFPRTYIGNDFEDQGEVVIDHATSLMWQKSGSPNLMTYAEAQEYIKALNRERFAGFADWRLPTIPELISLIELEQQENGLHINPIFDVTQWWCWSADRLPEGGSPWSAWSVNFRNSNVYWSYFDNTRSSIRAVRSK